MVKKGRIGAINVFHLFMLKQMINRLSLPSISLNIFYYNMPKRQHLISFLELALPAEFLNLVVDGFFQMLMTKEFLLDSPFFSLIPHRLPSRKSCWLWFQRVTRTKQFFPPLLPPLWYQPACLDARISPVPRHMPLCSYTSPLLPLVSF